jgi:UDP-glucose 4-epimerase
MILITGGLGFIGSQTARALADLGESCLLAQRRAGTLPPALLDGTGERIRTEQVDLTDREAFLALGRRYPITGIVHLAGSVPWPPGQFEPVDGARTAIGSLLNVVDAALEWQVGRVGIASTIGVYAGVDAAEPMREDAPLPMTAGHVIPAFKKIGEVLTDHLAGVTGVELFTMRISAIWGPLGRPTSVFLPAPQLVHAAVSGTAPDLSALYSPAYADNGTDMCYVKDCGRAIAHLQLARKLNHRTYNVASGRATTNQEVADAIAAVVPGTRIELPGGRDPEGPADDVRLDITRLHEDTGFRPAYDTERAVADYVSWLRAGNPK